MSLLFDDIQRLQREWFPTCPATHPERVLHVQTMFSYLFQHTQHEKYSQWLSVLSPNDYFRYIHQLRKANYFQTLGVYQEIADEINVILVRDLFDDEAYSHLESIQSLVLHTISLSQTNCYLLSHGGVQYITRDAETLELELCEIINELVNEQMLSSVITESFLRRAYQQADKPFPTKTFRTWRKRVIAIETNQAEMPLIWYDFTTRKLSFQEWLTPDYHEEKTMWFVLDNPTHPIEAFENAMICCSMQLWHRPQLYCLPA